MSSGGVHAEGGRHLAWWQFLVLVLVYVAIIQIGGRVIGADVDADVGLETAGNLVEAMLIPIALSGVFAIGIATWLGWWPQIIHEPLRTQRWVKIVPIALLLAAAIGASWSNLLDQNADLVLAVAVLVCVVGFTEVAIVLFPTMFGFAMLLYGRRHRIDLQRPAATDPELSAAIADPSPRRVT